MVCANLTLHLQTNINGTHFLLAALKDSCPECRFYFAGSSEMFGKVEETPQSETTRFHPRSVYGITKVAGFELTRNYREAYDLFTCTGILFNHESPLRGETFVTRKITRAVGRIKHGLQDKIYLGNLDAQSLQFECVHATAHGCGNPGRTRTNPAKPVLHPRSPPQKYGVHTSKMGTKMDKNALCAPAGLTKPQQNTGPAAPHPMRSAFHVPKSRLSPKCRQARFPSLHHVRHACCRRPLLSTKLA